MRIFILKRIEQCSDNYHPEGGLVVIAKDADQFWSLIHKEEHVEVTVLEMMKAEIFDLAGEPEPRVIVFPDAGCC